MHYRQWDYMGIESGVRTQVNLDFLMGAMRCFFAGLSQSARAIPYETDKVRYYAFAFRASAMAIRFCIKQNFADWHDQWVSNLRRESTIKAELWRMMGKRRGAEQHGSHVGYKVEWDVVPFHELSSYRSFEIDTIAPQVKRPRDEFDDRFPGSLVQQSKDYMDLMEMFVDALRRDAPEESRQKRTAMCPKCDQEFEL